MFLTVFSCFPFKSEIRRVSGHTAITNVGKAHLEGFGSFEGVIKTKGELYDFLRKKENSTIFIHHDNPYLMNIASGLNKIFYGSEENLYINGGLP